MNWEYLVFDSKSSAAALTKELNDHSVAGWELITAYELAPGVTRFVFRAHATGSSGAPILKGDS